MRVSYFKVPQLKSLSRACKLSANYKKAELIKNLEKFFMTLEKDPSRLQNNVACLAYLIDKCEDGEPLPPFNELITAKYYNKSLDSVHTKPKRPTYGNSGASTTLTSRDKAIMSPYANTIHFEESPFYKLEKLVPESAQKIYVTNGRGTCTIKFQLNKDEFHSLKTDQKSRLYLLCGMVNVLGTRGKETIQFPSPNEIQMNNQIVKANVKGIKNKKGTTKPVDITPYLKSDNSINIFQYIYAFTTTEYLIYLYIVKVIAPEEILKQILKQPKILKAATLYYLEQTINADADVDVDIITTSAVMSLNCPISYMRMKYPAKSSSCKHLQCFDALWFLHSQLQIPTWQCPVCQVPIKVEQLAISEYVEEILQKCDKNIEQVELFKDGGWAPIFDENQRGSDSESDGETPYNVKKDEKPTISVNTKHEVGEPFVISLDSDDDAEGEHSVINGKKVIQASTQNDSRTKQRTFIDNNNSDNVKYSRSLDPKGTPVTPNTKSFNSDCSSNKLNYAATKTSFVVDDSSLSSNYSTPLRDKDLEMHHPSILYKQIKFPQYLQSKPLYNHASNSRLKPNPHEVIEPASNIGRLSSISSQSTVIITNPSMALSDPQESNPMNDVSNENDISNTLKDVSFPSSRILSGTGQEQALNSGVKRPEGEVRKFPTIPLLPSLKNGDTIRNSSDKLSDSTQSYEKTPFVESSITMKPIVAPFQPRRNYSTTIPQKRHLSSSSVSSIPNKEDNHLA